MFIIIVVKDIRGPHRVGISSIPRNEYAVLKQQLEGMDLTQHHFITEVNGLYDRVVKYGYVYPHDPQLQVTRGRTLEHTLELMGFKLPMSANV